MRVNQNLFAANAQRHLFENNSQLSKSIEKLSSGLRINKAADDAAGLAVSETLRSQVSGLGVSISNAQDGISLIQTAEGGLDRMHVILRRVRDLTAHAANGDKTDTDRINYQAEVDQLLEEIDRISRTTEYNTRKLLNGQIGSNAKESADVDGVLQEGTVKVNGLVAAEGEYKFQFEQYATKAKAVIGGLTVDATAATGVIVTDVNAAGSFADFLVGTDAITPAQEGIYSYKVESEGKSVFVSVEASLNSGDSLQDAINKFNKAFRDSDMDLTASYSTDYSTDTSNDYQMGIIITSNTFGSKHDIHVSVASEPKSGATSGTGLYLTAGSESLIRNVTSASYALINSDLTTSKGVLSSSTEVVATNPENNSSAMYTSGSNLAFRIETRAGEIISLNVASGATIGDIVTAINTNALSGAVTPTSTPGFTAGNVMALFDDNTGKFRIVDNTDAVGTNVFKIDNGSNTVDSSVVGLATQLGIYAETTGNEVNGPRISKTKDYVISVTDPKGTTGTLIGNFGDRSTYFGGIESNSPIVSSGIDPDRNGPESAGKGGLAGISFQLEEKQLDISGGQNRFSILAEMGSLTFQIGPNKGEDHRISIMVNNMSTESLGVAGLDISTQTKAQKILDSGALDNAINTVSLQRGRLGAMQNRLDHTVKNLSITKENLQSGESRIRDVDVAEETVAFTRNQIMSQAGTAMLAQANQIPQGVLQLLGG